MILKSSKFPKDIKENYLTIQIGCLFEGFKDSPMPTNLWVQQSDEKIGAIILGYGQTAFISYFGGDEGEIAAFLSALSFKNIVSDKSFSFLNILRKDKIFKKALDKTALPLPEIPSLTKIYETLSFGLGSDISLPDFESFAPDTSHLLRHGFAFSVLTEYGACLVHFLGGKGILKGISVKEEFRQKGCGTKLLNSCLEFCPSGLFAATSKSEDFYLKNGFLKEPYNIYFGELK